MQKYRLEGLNPSSLTNFQQNGPGFSILNLLDRANAAGEYGELCVPSGPPIFNKMSLDPHNIPENIDWREKYFKLNENHHAALLEIIDLKNALRQISQYDISSVFGRGICPYGCDTPNIAQQALLKSFNQDECGEEYRDMIFCALEKGHTGNHETSSGVSFG